MNRAVWCGLWLGLAACGSKDDSATVDSDTEPQTTPETTHTGEGDQSCGDAAPTIEDLEIDNEGLTDDCNDQPGFTLSFSASDPDGDLHELEFMVWIEEDDDGEVDTSGNPTNAGTGVVQGAEECEAGLITLTLLLCVDNGIEPSTIYDIGVAINDADGNTSNVIADTWCTPNADGSDCGSDTGATPTITDTSTTLVDTAPPTTSDTGSTSSDTGSTDTQDTTP